MSIMCRACRRSNDPWRRFCGGCGSNLPGGCTHCGTVNRTDDKFCGGCARAQRGLPSTLPSVFKEQQQQQTVPIDLTDVISET
jgi:Double zinc ribbon